MKLNYSIILIFCLSFFIGSTVLATNDKGFIENKGQIHNQDYKANTTIKYLLSTGRGMNVQLLTNSFSYDTYWVEEKEAEKKDSIPMQMLDPRDSVLSKEYIYHFHRVDIELIGANPIPQIEALYPSKEYFNYYNAVTPEEGATNVHHYKKVVYKNIYPNIDLEFEADLKNEKLPFKYNFIVHVGGNIADIKLHYKGANNTQLKDGNIAIEVEQTSFIERIPLSFEQESAKEIKVNYTQLKENQYGLQTEKYDTKQTLIIDPTPERIWGTYVGGEGYEWEGNITSGKDDHVYIIGKTNSMTMIATTGVHQSINNDSDVYIAKIDNQGIAVWGTYYGGQGDDSGSDIITDSNNDICILGTTRSVSGMTTINTHQPTIGGGNTNGATYGDCFVAKLNSNGQRIWGTYYGGYKQEKASGLTVDSNDNIYFTGYTFNTSGISSIGVHQPTFGSSSNLHSDGIIVKLNPSGQREWGTFYGGANADAICDIEYDKTSETIKFIGFTESTNAIATVNAYQPTKKASYDVFIGEMTLNGMLNWSTYYGGNQSDMAFWNNCGITVDDLGNTYIAALTQSSDLSLSINTYLGGADWFVSKFTNTGQLEWTKYCGGEGYETVSDILFHNNALYTIGSTASLMVEITADSYQNTHAGGYYDAIILKMDLDGNTEWSTYYGGANYDVVEGITFCNNELYIMGKTDSDNLSTIRPMLGASDAFIAKFREPCPTDLVEIGVPNNTTESKEAKILSSSGRRIVDTMNETLKKNNGTALFRAYDRQNLWHTNYPDSYTKYTTHTSLFSGCSLGDNVPLSVSYYLPPPPQPPYHNKNPANYFVLRWSNLGDHPYTFRLYNYAVSPNFSDFIPSDNSCLQTNHDYRVYTSSNIHTINYIDYSNTIIDEDEPNYNTTPVSWLQDPDGLPFTFHTSSNIIENSTLKGPPSYSGNGTLYFNHIHWKEQITVRRVLICEGENVVLTAPAGGTNYLWSNGATTQQISATQEGMYSFSYEQSGCTINSDVVYIKYDDCPTPPCETTASTTLTFPVYQLNEVINTSAQTLSDNWMLNKYTPFKVYGSLDLPEANSRPYVVGKQGIWRGESSFAYVKERTQTPSNVNLRKDGTYTLNMFNWKYLGELDCPEWRKVETVSEYHPQSSDVERYNILKLYSSFHIGYSDQLVSAAAANSKQYEFGFEGFEEYTSQIESANANLLFATQTTISNLKIPYWFTLETGRNRRIWSSLELQTLQNQYAFTKLHVLGKQIDVNYPGEFRSHTTFEAITIDTDKSLITFSQNEEAPFEGFWTGKVGVTIDKIATQTFSGTAPQLVDGIAHTGKKSLKVSASASFEQPYLLLIPNKKYVVSAWVRVDQENKPLRSASYQDYADLKVKLGNGTNLEFKPQGQIIEGWQRIEGNFTVPNGGMEEWSIQLASTGGLTTYFDDIRLFPSLGNMESFVYDTETFRLEAKLDANNYATFYYYDAEGRLYLVKQETAKGVQTLQTVTTHTKRD